MKPSDTFSNNQPRQLTEDSKFDCKNMSAEDLRGSFNNYAQNRPAAGDVS
jgi:hypothetical protein